MTVPDLSSEDTRDVGKRASVMECASPLALFPINPFPAERDAEWVEELDTDFTDWFLTPDPRRPPPDSNIPGTALGTRLRALLGLA